jgi:hypothetical protein
MDEAEYFRAARCIRMAQYEHFCRARLESQPAGAIQAHDLLAAFSQSCSLASADTTDVKVKVGDSEEGIRCVSLEGEILVIESKSKGFAGVLRSKRTLISTPGLPVTFLNPLTVAVPARDADVSFTFPDSLARDMFALKFFLHSKGDPQAEWFSVSAAPVFPLTPSASSPKTRSVKSNTTDSVFISRCA